MGRAVNTSIWIGAGLVALSISIASAQAPARAKSPAPIELPHDPAKLARLLEDAVQREAAKDTALRGTVAAIVDGPALERLDPRRQHRALFVASRIAAEARDLERAHTLMRRSTSLSTATSADWMWRSTTATLVGDFDDAASSVATVAERWPEALERIGEQSIARVALQAQRSAGDESLLALLSALFDAKWRYQHRGEPSELWRELALLLLEERDTPKALEVVERITAANSIVRMRADRRFDSLRSLAPARFDVEAAAARELERFRESARSAPDLIEPVLALSAALAENGRCDEALAVVDEAIAHAWGPVPEGLPYRDGGELYVWLLDARASRLNCLGRDDEAVRQRVQAAALTENGRPNVSQIINLAGLYATLGRAQEALDVLDGVGEPSAFGKMQEQGVRLRAYVQLGNADGVRSALAYMNEHRDDALASYQGALLFSGDADGAAAVLIDRLRDPRERADTLFSVQIFGEAANAPNETRERSRWRELLERADVRAAIERVGRIESYPFLH